MEFKDKQEAEFFLLCACRYCFTRQSYAVGWCIDYLRRYLPHASKHFKDRLLTELCDEFHVMLDDSWLHFKEELIHEKEKERESTGNQ
mgnify:FL=1